MSFVPQEVVCPGCGLSFHETTELFTAERPASGPMFRLKPFFGDGGENWQSFPADEWVQGENLVCPGCGSPYTSGTRVKTRPLTKMVAEEIAEEAEQAAADPEVVEAKAVAAEMVREEPEKVMKVKIGGKA